MRKELEICGKNIGTYKYADGDPEGVQFSEVTLNDHIFNLIKQKGYKGEHEDLSINVDIYSGDVYIINPKWYLYQMSLSNV
jgi:hypothetical protein